MTAQTIKLPLYSDSRRSVNLLGALGWVFELWGCRISDAWLRSNGGATIEADSFFFPLELAPGWVTRKPPTGRTAAGERIDFWIVDELDRPRAEIVFAHPEDEEPAINRITLCPRFWTILTEDTEENGKQVLKMRAMENPGRIIHEERAVFPEVAHESERGRGERRYSLSQEMRARVELTLSRHYPNWRDDVTAWFDPGKNPFESLDGYVATTSLYFRWQDILGQHANTLVNRIPPDFAPTPSLYQRIKRQCGHLHGT